MKHNSMLSELDSEALRLDEAWKTINHDLGTETASKFDFVEIDGNKILRWCAKTIAGTQAMHGSSCPSIITQAAFFQDTAEKLGFYPIVSENASLAQLKNRLSVYEHIPYDQNEDKFFTLALAGMPYLVTCRRGYKPPGIFYGINTKKYLNDRLAQMICTNGEKPYSSKHKRRVILFRW